MRHFLQAESRARALLIIEIFHISESKGFALCLCPSHGFEKCRRNTDHTFPFFGFFFNIACKPSFEDFVSSTATIWKVRGCLY